MEIEEWREVEGFDDWLVSNYGRVMNNWTQKILRVRPNQQGLIMVGMTREGEQFTRLVSLLVAHAFLEKPKNSAYNSVIHLNGDRTDCRAMNLMWRPRWFALKYHQMFETNPVRVEVYIPRLNKIFHSLREFCVTYGLIERHSYICMINGEPCFHYGWIIERYEK